jgi:hypothetical protein
MVIRDIDADGFGPILILPNGSQSSMHLDLMLDAVRTAIITTLSCDADTEAPPKGC